MAFVVVLVMVGVGRVVTEIVDVIVIEGLIMLAGVLVVADVALLGLDMVIIEVALVRVVFG